MTTATTPQQLPVLQHSLVLPCEAASARTARTWARGWLDAQGVPERIADVAVLLLSELVANAAQWTGCSRIGIHLRMRGCRLRVDVEDGSRSLPVRMPASATDENGRGLGLVHALAASSGVDLLPLGKSVWFELAVPTRPAAQRDALAPAEAA